MQKISTTHPLEVARQHVGPLPGTIGVERGEWYVEAQLIADAVIVSVTADNPQRALDKIVASDDPIDRWFKDEVRALTGVDIAALFGPLLGRHDIKH